MENVFIYFLKASALIAVYFTAYHFLLRKETFFNTNRWFLLAGLFTSAILPLFFIKKTIWVEKQKVSIDDLIQYSKAQIIPKTESFTIDWNQILIAFYVVISAFLLIKVITNLVSLVKLLHNKEVIKKDKFSLVDLNEDIAPFSFFNYIVFNSDYYTNEELRSILLHEKVHSEEKHSLDVMIAKIFCIVFWFNPFMWLYKKAIIQNLEYIADQKACLQIEDKKTYQKALLKVVSHQNCLSITNHFYQSLIKKRIVMLNKNQSHKRNSWKYTVVIPVLVAFFILFQIKVIAQERESKIVEKQVDKKVVSIVIDKNSSDNDIKKDADMLKKEHNVNLKVSKIKRNSQGEITGIKVEYKDNDGNNGSMQSQSDTPIEPIHFYKESSNDGRNRIGFGKPRMELKRSHGMKRLAEIHRDFDEDELERKIEKEVEEGLNKSFAWSFSDDDSKDGKSIERKIVIRKDGKNGKPEVIINGEKLDIPLADLEKMDKDFDGKFEFKSGDNGPFIFKFNDEEIMHFSPEDIERIKEDAMESSKAMEISKIHMKKMKEHMEKMRPDMERMREKMQYDKEERNIEMQKAREEMQKAREEMLKAKEEMKKAREEMEKAKSEMKTRKA